MNESKTSPSSRGILNWIERVGNRLPDPVSLFVIGALTVVVLSQIADQLNWTVTKSVLMPVMEPVVDSGSGEPVTTLRGLPDGRVARGENDQPLVDPVLTAVEDPQTGKLKKERVDQQVTAVGLLTRDGMNWAISNMVKNFVNFPPLGVVLVGMLGIGVAEKTGAIGALLKAMMLITPQRLLTPSMVFIGVMSSMALE